jgi:outer membrane protein
MKNYLIYIIFSTFFIFCTKDGNTQEDKSIKQTLPNNITPTNAVINEKVGLKIAYFEMDSIQNNYIYFKDVKSALQIKDIENVKELTSLRNAFTTKYQDLQKNGPSLSQTEITSRQQDLAVLEKKYTNKEQQLSQELQEESDKRLKEKKKRIQMYLAKYNKDKHFAFIFSSNPDLMYFKDPTYDITSEIIKGLNEDYKKKSDSN